MSDVMSDEALSVQAALERVIDDANQPAQPVVVPNIAKPPEMSGRGFFDPSDPSRPYTVVLRQLVEDGRETFKLERPIGYWDEHVGAVIVPANLATFRTDLTSVPRLFTWLVPKTGEHLSAALVHDGLVHNKSDPPTYVAQRPIDRATADRIFRDGMRDLQTPRVRRWLVWTAVTMATMATGAPWWRRLWFCGAIATTVGSVLVGGALATIDLLDRGELVPWMGDAPLWTEVLQGAVAALIVPAVLAVLWLKHYVAGLITGVALAFLIHVTVAVTVVFAAYSAVEALFEAQLRRSAMWAAVAAAPVIAIWWIAAWAG